MNFFISEHLADGYEFILPPHMLNWECGTVAGQFPKFAEEVYHIANPTSNDKKFKRRWSTCTGVKSFRKMSCPKSISRIRLATAGKPVRTVPKNAA